MLLNTVRSVELRGVEKVQSKQTGKIYYVGHFEDTETFKPYSFYLGENLSVLPENVKKGDLLILTLNYDCKYGKISLVSTVEYYG